MDNSKESPVTYLKIDSTIDSFFNGGQILIPDKDIILGKYKANIYVYS